MRRVTLWGSLFAVMFVGAQALEALGAPEVSATSHGGGGGTQLITMLVTWGLIKIGLAFIPANIAKKKGRKLGRWWVYGFFLFFPALIHSNVISSPTRKCPHCAESIQPDAKFCHFCGKEVPTASSAPQTTTASPLTKKCPYCAEDIKAEAKVCRYCGRDLMPAT
jgi:hypothetical protein